MNKETLIELIIKLQNNLKEDNPPPSLHREGNPIKPYTHKELNKKGMYTLKRIYNYLKKKPKGGSDGARGSRFISPTGIKVKAYSYGKKGILRKR